MQISLYLVVMLVMHAHGSRSHQKLISAVLSHGAIHVSSTLCCGRSVALVAQSCENSKDFVTGATKVSFIIYAFDVITTIALHTCVPPC